MTPTALKLNGRKIASLIVAGLMLELAGKSLGLAPSHIFYHYTVFNKDLNSIVQKYDIQIRNAVEPGNYPARWLNNPLLANQTIIKAASQRYQLSRFLTVVKTSFQKYPQQVLKKNLGHVYLLDEITIHGTTYGGTYSVDKSSIYIQNHNGPFEAFSFNASTTEKTIHHEVSSILMKNYGFSEVIWRAAMGKNFLYESDKDPTYQWMFFKGHVDTKDEATLLGRGLLRQYAETGVENDFNIYASNIFGEPKRMSKLIKAYPIIARKYQVFKDFYLSIDPGFAPVFEKIDGKP